MDYFNYKNHQLYAEDVSVAELAKQYGTPCYIYSRTTLERHWQAFDAALQGIDHLICYAVKANSNLAVLDVLAKLGSGFDIVSGGELERVLAIGADPQKIVFSGVGKTTAEMKRALKVGIKCFNVESEAELHQLQAIAKQANSIAPISIRVNPDVDAKTHPYIATGLQENKFGVDVESAMVLYQQAVKMSHLAVHGIDCHIGSQLTELEPFLAALDKVVGMIVRLKDLDITLQHMNLGGGLGVCYQDEHPPHPSDYGMALKERLNGILPQLGSLQLILEPGRVITANAGILVTEVLSLKHNPEKRFAIIDAGMNDLLRPALYQAWHNIIPVNELSDAEQFCYDVVGPVCETADFLAKARQLSLNAGDLLAVRGAGAYGFCMSSNYNSRPRVAEIMVDGDQAYLVRKRESFEQLIVNESVIP